MDAEQVRRFREEKDAFFKSHPQSPLTPEQRAAFKSLTYYEPNPELELTVRVEPFEEQDVIHIQTTTGEQQAYKRYGRFTFEVEGEAVELTIYAGAHGFFLPFADANAGKETYGAGRYLEPGALTGDDFLIDFNQAYNPFCAYNEAYSCPITPAENRVGVAIRAGEKSPVGEWAEH